MTFRSAECAKQLLPRDSYVDEAWLQAEQETLFATSWAFVGLASELKDVGDYRTVQVGRFSLVVVRGRDGELRGFHNICRHRGTELLDQGCGNAGKTIVCPYHRWTYGLDGALRGVPDQRVFS